MHAGYNLYLSRTVLNIDVSSSDTREALNKWAVQTAPDKVDKNNAFMPLFSVTFKFSNLTVILGKGGGVLLS